MSFHLQPCLFVTALHFGKEIKRKRWVDQEVNHPDERHLVVQWKSGFLVTALHYGKEIKRKRWVDQEVNHPEERHLVVQWKSGFLVTDCPSVKK